MRQLLAGLGTDAWVLDLGSASGSFPASLTAGRVVRFDLEPARVAGERAIRGDAARLPFADASFHAVVANHSMEHIVELELALAELGRVLKPDGGIFVSVPDATTLTDRIYRWLSHGGGHVNAFVEPMDLAKRVVRATNMPLCAMTLLYSGFSFINRKNVRQWPRRLYLLGGGFEWTLQAGTYLLRFVDSVAGTRLSVYGWAYYFGSVTDPELEERSNVCVRCGSGHSDEWLRAQALVRRFLLWRYYHCPGCHTMNLFLAKPVRTMNL